MNSRLQIAGHPIHAMVVGLPIGLYNAALICDVVYLLVADGFWFKMAFWLIVFGFITHAGAAITGLPDYLTVVRSKSPATRIAQSHLIFGLTLFVVQGLNLALRNGGTIPADGSITLPFVINLIAVSLLGLQGWYGGELVYRHRIGIND